jgi:hypothetical protein
MATPKSPRADFHHRVQAQQTWRRQQEGALTHRQQQVYQHLEAQSSQVRKAMVKTYKAHRARLIEEEYRQRLLHHPQPVLAMLPLRPKTKERIRREATHAVMRRHVRQIMQLRREHQQRLDRYLQLAERQRQQQQPDLALKPHYAKAKVRDLAKQGFIKAKDTRRRGRSR